jgi:hypothetical protein
MQRVLFSKQVHRSLRAAHLSRMIHVHHLNNSRSQRILWLLEELEVPYDIVFYQRGADQRAPKELRNIHPLGKSPVITDGDITLAESGAIIQYIINKYGNGRVAPPPEGEPADLFCNDSANLKQSLSLNGLTDNFASHSLLRRHFDASPR